MNVKKILLISLIAVAVVASFSAVSAGLLDTLMDDSSQGNVVEIENITFNTTNATEFEYVGIKGEWTAYMSKDKNYTCAFINYTGLNDSQYDSEITELKDYLDANFTVQNVNGVDVYKLKEIGENDTVKYFAYGINDDLKFVVQFNHIDPNETAYMASTLEFK